MPKIAIKTKLANLKSAPRFSPEDESAFQQGYYLQRRTAIIASLWVMVAFWLPVAFYCLINSNTPTFVIYSAGIVNALLLWSAFHPRFAQMWQPLLVATTIFLLALPMATTNSEDSYNYFTWYIYPLFIVFRLHHLHFRWTVLQLLGVSVAFAYVTGSTETGKWDWSGAIFGFLFCAVIGLCPLLISLFSERKERARYLQAPSNYEQDKYKPGEAIFRLLSRAVGHNVDSLASLRSALSFSSEDEPTFQRGYHLKHRDGIIASVCITAALWLLTAFISLRVGTTPPFIHYVVSIVNGLLLWLTFRPGFARIWQPMLVATTVFLLILPLATLPIDDPYNIVAFYVYPLLIIFRIYPLQFRWTVLQLLGVIAALTCFSALSETGKEGEWVWSTAISGFSVCAAVGLFPLINSLKNELRERTKYSQAPLTYEQGKYKPTETVFRVLSQAIGRNVHSLANLKSALRFSPEDEPTFQSEYYLKRRPGIIVSVWIMAVLWAFAAFISLLFSGTPLFVLFTTGVVNGLLLWLAFRPRFAQVWQPVLAVAPVFLLAFTLTTTHGNDLFNLIIVGAYPLLIVFRIHHLQFRWTALQLLGTGVALTYFCGLSLSNSNKWDWNTALSGLFFCVCVGLFPLLNSLKSELSERAEHSQKALIALERDAEREKREQTEKMLHILSQAIGGIVHDLGNPLTAVQGGAETLLYFVKEGKPDKELVREFATMITDGAQMLNYLRLSLMEQTRVLEGKPTPIEPSPTSIHHMVKAGAHYQKPRFAAGRNVSFEGEDLEVCVDEMRFITVFMNLIGNALKYSDGEVRITWSQQRDHILIAVQDQGLQGKGITQTQAEKLFVAFGRLDTHAQIEGTGLGLLSVRKIAEAHDGEVYIEGHTDGTIEAPTFNTAQGTYTSILEKGFTTAFVTACPLKVLSHQQQVSEHYAP